MVYAAGSKYGTWNPKTGAVTIIKNFGSGYSDCKFGPWEGSPTRDGDMVVISCNQGGFAYKIIDRQEIPGHRQVQRRRTTCGSRRSAPT